MRLEWLLTHHKSRTDPTPRHFPICDSPCYFEINIIIIAIHSRSATKLVLQILPFPVIVDTDSISRGRGVVFGQI
ncbi:hypothetical protein L1987_65594 [Smallanthus sonchifolius]|uniref:Uncharacterized protein n=1 Tax=Smallanthus sonchifolius TaxID=185202 RepID=A0ACB9BV18_9ASTR|nr:hypothetical protein L1987_65594 [Smallanthus sonchifolius]